MPAIRTATRPKLRTLPAHLLEAGDIIYFPACGGSTITDRFPLAIVVGVELPERPDLGGEDTVALVTEDQLGGQYIDYVEPWRMFPAVRQVD